MASSHAGGLARTPPMGWNSWNKFACNIDEEIFKETADAMRSSGLRNVGYEYIILDDCWMAPVRDADGYLWSHPDTFPSGIQALSNYVHARGLKMGIYQSRGTETCMSRPGSFGYETHDADAFAAWGVDYLKYDSCFASRPEPNAYTLMRNALNDAGRDILFSICSWHFPGEWALETGHLWRTTSDIVDCWDCEYGVLWILDQQPGLEVYAGPGRWNDPDMLQVGNGGMTNEEYRAHFSLWAILAAPLIAGNDLRTMSPETLEILANTEVVAVDQDRDGIQGSKVFDDGAHEVWARPLYSPYGTRVRAVVLLNRGGSAADITVNWSDIGLPADTQALVRDLWAHRDLGAYANSFTANVPSHGAVMVKITGTRNPPPTTDAYLSDLEWIWSHTHMAREDARRDTSHGGNPITLDGTVYPKGLGVHSRSNIWYNLGGNCSTLAADIGLDDEVGDYGSVTFEVWTDGVKRYESRVLTGSSAVEQISVNVRGARTLRLTVTTSGDDNKDYDHADWANARVHCGSGAHVPDQSFQSWADATLLLLPILPTRLKRTQIFFCNCSGERAF